MARILMLYGTNEGQTEKISIVIQCELKSQGHEVDLFNSRQLPLGLHLDSYDAVIIGASVHASGFQKEVLRWVKLNLSLIQQKPGAFFSVCLGILQTHDAKVQSEVREIVKRFFSESGWSPQDWTIFAGALKYSKYGWIMKRMMRSISKKAGVDTDMSRDYEYTDWKAVKDFAVRFSAALPLFSMKIPPRK